MTQIQAQTVVSALVGLGYAVVVKKLDVDNWILSIANTNVSATDVANFAAANGVTAIVNQVDLS